jgi:hypothetical protein
MVGRRDIPHSLFQALKPKNRARERSSGEAGDQKSANPLTAFSDKLILSFADSFPEEEGSRRLVCFATIFVRPFMSTLLAGAAMLG